MALVAVGVLGWYHFLFPGFEVSGQVNDGESGSPLVGARVWAGSTSTTTDATGAFALQGVKPPEVVSFEAPGYGGTSARTILPTEELRSNLQPLGLDILVNDADTNTPVAGAVATVGDRQLRTGVDGKLRVAPVLPNSRIALAAPGYAPSELAYDGTPAATVRLAPSLNGQVVDAATGRPLKDVRLNIGSSSVLTDVSGGFKLDSRGVGTVSALMPGYRKATLDPSPGNTLELRMQPIEVKALYLTYYAVGNDDFKARMYRLLDTTELNSVVLDVKGDRGYLSYRSNVPLAQQIGANDHPTIGDIDALLKTLKERNAYTIARIVIFKDDLLAINGSRAGLDVAIKDSRTGEPWSDGEELAWVDPFQTASWDYNVALAREAIERGFDEVQFDYIRFPTDPSQGNSIGNAQYSKPLNEANRVEAITTFLGRAREAVNAAGGYLGIDTFGYTTWWEDDGGIGQDLAKLASFTDYVSPMIYPSTFSAGLPGDMSYPAVVQHPYEVVYESVVRGMPKIEGKRVVMRPWIQYYDDYPWATGFRYEAAQINDQKRAVADGKATGWMLWDPFNTYNRGGIEPKPAS